MRRLASPLSCSQSNQHPHALFASHQISFTWMLIDNRKHSRNGRNIAKTSSICAVRTSNIWHCSWKLNHFNMTHKKYRMVFLHSLSLFLTHKHFFQKSLSVLSFCNISFCVFGYFLKFVQTTNINKNNPNSERNSFKLLSNVRKSNKKSI